MEIHWFESLESTQTFLIDALKQGKIHPPVCIGADTQTAGKGSRGNDWIGQEGNLFLSLAIRRDELPSDLKLESSSIYFAFLMKELLESLGSTLWLKWPNDFYLGEAKIGGVITNLTQDLLICGIGINLASAPQGFDALDLDIKPYDLTNKYCELFKNLPTWKQIFSKYQLEFEKSRKFFTHYDNEKITLQKAILLEDGSLECDGQRIFSLR